MALALMVLTASLTSPQDAAGSPPHPLLMSKKQDGIINQINVFGHWETIAADDYSGPDGFADEALNDVAAQPEENWYAFSICEDGATSPSNSIGSGAVESTVRRVVNLRLKGASVFWTEEHAEGVLHLRAQSKSGRWKKLERTVLENGAWKPTSRIVREAA